MSSPRLLSSNSPSKSAHICLSDATCTLAFLFVARVTVIWLNSMPLCPMRAIMFVEPEPTQFPSMRTFFVVPFRDFFTPLTSPHLHSCWPAGGSLEFSSICLHQVQDEGLAVSSTAGSLSSRCWPEYPDLEHHRRPIMRGEKRTPLKGVSRRVLIANRQIV